MIYIDPRKGSGSFLRPLRRAGAPCKRKFMRFADFKLVGNGPDGQVRVGIERKTNSEIVGEISNKRFMGHQLPGLVGKRADGERRYHFVFVIIEGDRYIDKRTGLLNPQAFRHLPRRGHLFRTVQKFELTLMLKGGVRVIYTKNKWHTTEVIAAIHDWFCEPWKKHKSVYVVDESKPDAAILEQRTMKRKVANQLFGLAWKRSLLADSYFPSIVSMIVGDRTFQISKADQEVAVENWMLALRIKKGTKIARAIVDACHRRDDVKAKGQ